MKMRLWNSLNGLIICKPLAFIVRAHRTFSLVFLVQRIYASCAQSGLKKKPTLHFLFFITLALEMLFPIKLSHLLSIVFVCDVTITMPTTFDDLKLNWIKTQPRREGQKIRRCLLYTETKKKKRVEKCGQGERAAWACFACTRVSVREGVDRAPQCCLQLSDNSCSESRDVLRVLRHVSLFLHLSFHLSAFHRTDIR